MKMWRNSLLPLLTAAAALLGTVQAAPLDAYTPVDKRASSFTYGQDKIRGVNLGGWFVLEPWITPSIFSLGDSVVDEYTYTKTLGKAKAFSSLNTHWKTWITQADFQAIAHAGLNHVRIPIGYWAVAPLPSDPYVQGQLPILDEAVKWARAAGLKILLDLHGAAGSQNGFDNSGKYGAVEWQKQSGTVQDTLTALRMLSARYKNDADVISAIELLNEPLGSSLDLNGIKSFYTEGVQTVRSAGSQGVAVAIHDAFEDFATYWTGFLTGQDVLLDTHQYQIFTPEQVSQTPVQHASAACALGPKLAGLDKPGLVGEWTGAQTDCAKWLNGYGKGARYDGSFTDPNTGKNTDYVGSCAGKYAGSVSGLSKDDKDNLRGFVEAQLDAYEQGKGGWIFWTWKTESAPEWHMQDLLAQGLFPQPLSNRVHPGQCG